MKLSLEKFGVFLEKTANWARACVYVLNLQKNEHVKLVWLFVVVKI